MATNMREQDGEAIFDVKSQYNVHGRKIEGYYFGFLSTNGEIAEVFPVSFKITNDHPTIRLSLYSYNEDQTCKYHTTLWLSGKQ